MNIWIWFRVLVFPGNLRMGLNILIVYLERGIVIDININIVILIIINIVIDININIVINGFTGMTFCTFGLHYYQYLDSGQKSEYKV